MKKENFTPEYRIQLKARIFTAGYRTMTEFSKKVGVDISRVSRIIGGWENPSAKLAESMAKTLNLSPAEFKELL